MEGQGPSARPQPPAAAHSAVAASGDVPGAAAVAASADVPGAAATTALPGPREKEVHSTVVALG